MLNTTMSVRGRDTPHVHREPVRASRDAWLARDCILARYLEGWAEANPAKIFDATAAGYCFHDPLVGSFSRRGLPEYFERLQAQFVRTGLISRQDLSFQLRGPMDWLSRHDELEFWRTAPRVGLTGTSQIKAGRAASLPKASHMTSTWHLTFCPTPSLMDLVEGTVIASEGCVYVNANYFQIWHNLTVWRRCPERQLLGVDPP